jgi:uncharacterized membrane protein
MMYLLSLLMVLAGIFHFVKPKFFLAIMPPYIPAHQLMVALSGLAEIIFGAGLLLENTRSWATWGLLHFLLPYFLPTFTWLLPINLNNFLNGFCMLVCHSNLLSWHGHIAMRSGFQLSKGYTSNS